MGPGENPTERDASGIVFSPSDIDHVALTAHERSAFRQQTAKHEAPWIAASVAVLALVLATMNSVLGTDEGGGTSFQENIPIFLSALLLAIAAPLLGRPWLPAAAVPWISAGLATLMVLALLFQEYKHFSDTGLLYALFAIAAYGPLAMDFRAAISAAVPMLIGCIWVSMSLASPANVDWTVASIAALMISGVLLSVRLRGVDSLAKALALHAALATEDPLTGMLNRRGLNARLGQVFSLAARGQVTISAMFVDIDGLKQVNDRHGHNMGDQVIKATAEAIQSSVRGGDLTCRWGGDEFLILGIGSNWNSDVLTQRIREFLAKSEIPTGQWPGTATFGWATIDPAVDTFDELVRQADADMYSRRARRKV
ncbi:MAG: GGDEF domain-containing protein [Actinomycetota bacterium]|nr:GGDEF domain-containing protein [Actinomycetota bacterium]